MYIVPLHVHTCVCLSHNPNVQWSAHHVSQLLNCAPVLLVTSTRLWRTSVSWPPPPPPKPVTVVSFLPPSLPSPHSLTPSLPLSVTSLPFSLLHPLHPTLCLPPTSPPPLVPPPPLFIPPPLPPSPFLPPSLPFPHPSSLPSPSLHQHVFIIATAYT